jgi:hypothetical protein
VAEPAEIEPKNHADARCPRRAKPGDIEEAEEKDSCNFEK